MKRTSALSTMAMYALVAALVLVVAGCTVRVYRRGESEQAQGQQTTVRDDQGSSGGNVQAELATGVTVVEVTCSPGSQEVCDGLDNNCNGVIDEGCGYSTGEVQITLAWDSGADIDVYVTDPNNETIYYGHRRSSSGGHLDRDARGACGGSGGDHATVENVYWDTQAPPPGSYKVEVHYWAGSSCSTNAGPTPVTLSIAVGGEVIGAYNYVLNADQRVAVASFNL